MLVVSTVKFSLGFCISPRNALSTQASNSFNLVDNCVVDIMAYAIDFDIQVLRIPSLFIVQGSKLKQLQISLI